MKNTLLMAMILLTLPAFAQTRTNPKSQEEELGKVRWYRDYNQAIRVAAQQQKDILILFQEVPGCATCRNYGHNVLTHPLMVEAIENCFVPLAIFNNKEGKDRQILKKFKEPSWNNPVVRIVNIQGEDVIPRIASNYSAKGLYDGMKKALDNKKVALPAYFQLLGQELSATKTGDLQTQYFQMYCFWSGEKHLGQQKGVLSTEPGFMNSAEVVKIEYDNAVIPKEKLFQYASQHSLRPVNEDSSYRKANKDDKYYLQFSAYKYLPLTKLQQTKINSALGRKENAEQYLSPQQLTWYKALQKNSQAPVRYNQPFVKAWYAMEG